MLSTASDVRSARLHKALSEAIWEYTEADDKYGCRFRSAGAMAETDSRQLRHEHVLTRRGLVAALLAEPTKVEEILATSNRLARDLVLQESLLAEVWRLGARVFSTSASEDAYLSPDGAEGDPSRAPIRQVLGAVSEYERSMIRLRLRAGKVRKAQGGGYIGGWVPLGYQATDKALVVDDVEQQTLARIHELRNEGASLRAICRVLTDEARRTKRGGIWHPNTVAVVLRGRSA